MAAGACEQEGAAWVGAATDAFRQPPAATELGSWSLEKEIFSLEKKSLSMELLVG